MFRFYSEAEIKISWQMEIPKPSKVVGMPEAMLKMLTG